MKTIFLPILAVAACFSFSNKCSAQVPGLGVAASYRIFSAVGAINSTGTTVINGDIGTNNGAFNFSTPGVISGQTHNVDTVSMQVAAAVTSSYTDFGNIACDSTIPVGLGNGQVLPAKTYCIGALSSLDGTLYLDGANDTGSKFIFNIGGAFSTGIASNIMLMNGAQISNVYWRIGGQVDLGGNSTFVGTLLIDGGSLNLATGANLIGSGLVVNGAVNLASNAVSTAGFTPLPIILTDFHAYAQGNKCLLEWNTADAQSVKNFIVEKSKNANSASWESVLTTEVKGNPAIAQHYEAVDNTPGNNLVFYRLKIMSDNGSYSYSPVQKLLFAKADATVSVAPNPVSNEFTVTSNEADAAGISCAVIDITGRVVTRFILNQSFKIQTTGWPAGLYYLKAGDKEVIKIEKL